MLYSSYFTFMFQKQEPRGFFFLCLCNFLLSLIPFSNTSVFFGGGGIRTAYHMQSLDASQSHVIILALHFCSFQVNSQHLACPVKQWSNIFIELTFRIPNSIFIVGTVSLELIGGYLPVLSVFSLVLAQGFGSVLSVYLCEHFIEHLHRYHF